MTAAAQHRPGLAVVLREWGRIGCIGFGGPPTHIALLRDLCVRRRQLARGRRLRGRDRRLQPPARPGLDTARDLLRLAPARARSARSSAGSRSSSPGSSRSSRCSAAVPRRAHRPTGCSARARAPEPPWPRSPCTRAGACFGPSRARAASLGALARVPRGRRDRRRDGRPVARPAPARMRAARARGSERAQRRRRVPAAAARRRPTGGLLALAWVALQGRRALVRRRVRDRPAHAGRMPSTATTG